MSYQSQYEREEEALYDQYERGEITQKELQKELRELAYDYRAAAENSALDAYEAELDRW